MFPFGVARVCSQELNKPCNHPEYPGRVRESLSSLLGGGYGLE